jgi:flagellar biosynthesis protein FlhB
MSDQVCPKTWLAESILVTLLCCLPFGIVGIVYASKVSSLFAQGLYDQAAQASSSAKTWTLIGFFIGLVVTITYLAIYGAAIIALIANS